MRTLAITSQIAAICEKFNGAQQINCCRNTLANIRHRWLSCCLQPQAQANALFESGV
jgi:hypothetical protein